jgi:hypothetical protein
MILFEIFKSVEICAQIHRFLPKCPKYIQLDYSSLNVHIATLAVVVYSDQEQIYVTSMTQHLGKIFESAF